MIRQCWKTSTGTLSCIGLTQLIITTCEPCLEVRIEEGGLWSSELTGCVQVTQPVAVMPGGRCNGRFSENRRIKNIFHCEKLLAMKVAVIGQ